MPESLPRAAGLVGFVGARGLALDRLQCSAQCLLKFLVDLDPFFLGQDAGSDELVGIELSHRRTTPNLRV